MLTPVSPGITYCEMVEESWPFGLIQAHSPWRTNRYLSTFLGASPKNTRDAPASTVKEDNCSLDGRSTCSSAPRRHVQSLLWSCLLAVIKAPEQPVVRAVIGSTLIEENEILFQEADALEEILHGIETETQRRLSSHRLFDTPARLLLEREIQLLLQSSSGTTPEVQGAGNASQSEVAAAPSASCPQPIQSAQRKVSSTSVHRESGQAEIGRTLTREKSRKNVKDTSTSTRLIEAPLGKLDLRNYHVAGTLDPAIACRLVDSPIDKRVVSYVIGKSVLQERAKSGLSSDGCTPRTNSSRSLSSDLSSSHNETPESRASSALSVASCNTGMVVDCLKPYLNCYDIDVVADKIRHALGSERAVLLEDVAYLRDCLERSTELYSCVKNAPPSLGELRDCGKNLQRRLHSEMQFYKMNKVVGTRVGKLSLDAMQQALLGLKPMTPNGRHQLPTLGILPKQDIPEMIRKNSNELSFQRTNLGAYGNSLTPRDTSLKKDAFRRRHSSGH